MSNFVNNKDADFTKNLPEPSLEVKPSIPHTEPIKHNPNPLTTSVLPPEPTEDMPIPKVDDQIFKIEKPAPVEQPKPVKKKRQLSERQLAHLARMREKSLQKRRAKKQQKELEKQQKLKEKELKKVPAKPVPKPHQAPMPNIPEEIKKTAKKSGQSVEEFFGNVKLFMDTMEQYQRLKKPKEPTKPVNIPKPKPVKPVKQKPYVAKSYNPIRQDLFTIDLNKVNKNNFRNPFGF